jgi:hypothetical protein
MEQKSWVHRLVRRWTIAVFLVAVPTLMLCSRIAPAGESDRKKEALPKMGLGPMKDVSHPVALQIVYWDEEVIFGQQEEQHVGIATYTFKNCLPIPIKIVFPPLGYTSGTTLPTTPYCNAPQRMPNFANAPRIIELAPFAERRFSAGYDIACARGSAPPPERFVFGPSANNDQKGVIVDAVVSVGRFELPKGTDGKNE